MDLELAFNPANDSIHENVYTCRVTTPYGVQEQMVQVIAQSETSFIPCLLRSTTYPANIFTPDNLGLET